MDPGSPSPFSDPEILKARGSDAEKFEIVPLSILTQGQWDPGRDDELEKLWSSEQEIESVVDGVVSTAVTQTNHRVATDRQKFSTLGYQKKQKTNVLPEFATISKGASGTIKPRGALKQGLFNQGQYEKAAFEFDSFRQALESFLLPKLPDWRRGGQEQEEEGTDAILGENWTHFVHSHSTMDKEQRHQQAALWELIQTELNYIRQLTIIKEVVIAALDHVRSNGFLSEITPELLFSNLPSILQAHHLFWQEVMQPMVKEVKETGKPFDPMKLEKGCLEFSERFTPYLQYCWEEERIIDFTRKQASNLLFQVFLEWVETCPLVDRMRLGDMQAKPHQRITKYPLLLKAILKNTQDAVVKYTVRKILSHVNSFLDNINEYLAFKADELALSQTAQRVEGYEVAETMSEEIDKHLKEFCRFNLTCPIRGLEPSEIRKLRLEETLKIREKKDNKVEVIVLLFTDVLLVTKMQRKTEKLKVVRPPLDLERTHCFALKDGCSFLLVEMTELGCAANVYVLFTPGPESCSTWVSAIFAEKESLVAKRKREMALGNGELGQINKVDQSNPEPAPFSEQIPKKQSSIKFINGTLPFTEVEKDLKTQLRNFSPLLGRNSPSSQSAHGNFAMGLHKRKNSQPEKKDVVMLKESRSSPQMIFDDNLLGIREIRATWNHNKGRPYSPILNKHKIVPSVNIKGQSDVSHFQFHGKLQNPDIALRESAPSPASSIGEELNVDGSGSESTSEETPPDGNSRREMFEGQSSEQRSRRHSDFVHSGDDFAWESRSYRRKTNSPLARRRPVGSQHSGLRQAYRKSSLYLEDDVFAFSGNPSRTARQPTHKSHSYLGLEFLRRNGEALQNGAGHRASPEPGATSEPELPIIEPKQSSKKRPKFRSQRSASNPDIRSSVEADDSQSSKPEEGARPYALSLADVLERAKERQREGQKAGTTKNLLSDLTPSASQSPSPSLSPIETDVEFLRPETPTVAQEIGNEKEKDEESSERREQSSSPAFVDDASVDWPGLCVDGDDFMGTLDPGQSRGQNEAGEGGSRMLAVSDFRHMSTQEDGECSEV
ncbi:hypothetical protein GJAV_G00006500 [Gymnothorax javanicus]|nr:hypothetical protein GJAV_G00006500 [Gymnothorax javanicus]